MKYKYVVFDIDNTITELQFVMDYMAKYFKKKPVVEEKVLSFNLAEAYRLSKDENLRFWREEEIHLINQAVLAKKRLESILDQYTRSKTKVAFITARDKKYLKATENWLNKQSLNYEHLACVGKESKLLTIEKEFPKAEAVFEDNPKFFYEVWDKGLFSALDTYCVGYEYNYGVPSKYRLDKQTGKEIALPRYISD